MNDLFFVFGLGLTVMAVVLAFVGMRLENFPSKSAMKAGLALMVLLVVGSAAYAVALAREEHEVREVEIEEYRAEQAEELEEGEETPEEEPTDEPVVDGGTLELTSPEEGDLVFDPTTLEADAGEVTLDYINPSPVPHNVAIEDGSETVAQGETVTEGESGPATAALEPGEYIYYCSIPSHRENGMEGTLTVK